MVAIVPDANANNSSATPPMLEPIERFGAFLVRHTERYGLFLQFSWRVLVAICTRPGSWAKWPRLSQQLDLIGTRSAPVLALTGLFIGAVLAIESFDLFAQFGLEQRLGAGVNISVVKQIGPVLAAVMLAGRVGCALAAELGSMRVTDQLDAMRVMAADPVRVLVAPRVVACVLMIPALTVISNLCGIAGGWVIIVAIEGVNSDAYWQFTAMYIDWWDVMAGLIKAVCFAFSIGLISCFKGFHCRAGAQGVGRATTEAFVTSFVAIVLMNFVLAKLLNDLEPLLR
ncbi:MAG: MlaE family ABC transporter permease [Phycisphaerales bacterium JB050]